METERSLVDIQASTAAETVKERIESCVRLKIERTIFLTGRLNNDETIDEGKGILGHISRAFKT